MSLLEEIRYPQDLRRLKPEDLPALAQELREELLRDVSKTGGHLGANLGVVELTVALHYFFNTPTDKIVWDVSHQVYVHKMLTGRREKMSTLRQYQGLAGFSRPTESPYDVFGAGHGSTAMSAGLGLVMAREITKQDYKVVVVVGDSSMTGGMSLEAMNQAGHLKKGLLVILNDNEWAISKSVGAMAGYLNRIITGHFYHKAKAAAEQVIKRAPHQFVQPMLQLARHIEEGVKGLVVPGVLFEELGFTYFGPVDGHSIPALLEILHKIKVFKGPLLLHVITKKGKGYPLAEKDPAWSHGVTPFDLATGKPLVESAGKKFTAIFGDAIVEAAERDDRVVGITAAMTDGTGLERFSKIFPERFFDVGMAEQHAITFAAGMASEGLRPVAAIYSTFLQRSFDQILHDVCLQNLPVVFALDRAGLVGEDGPTHHGVFDLSYLRMMPNMVIMAPADHADLKLMVPFAIAYESGPIAIRYPRSAGKESVQPGKPCPPIEMGKAVMLREGKEIVLLAVGNMVGPALAAAELLSKENIQVGVVNMRFVKPLDRELILELSKKYSAFVTIEDNVVAGGMGSGVLELLEQEGINSVTVKCLGIGDHFVEHGSLDILYDNEGLTPSKIQQIVRSFLSNMKSKGKG